jgi:predicted PurR-regulated permease PerM
MGDESNRSAEPSAAGSVRRAAPAVASALLGVALVGFVLVLMRLAAPVLNPILLALFLTALAAPGFRWLQRKGLRRGPVLVGIVLVGALGGLALVPPALLGWAEHGLPTALIIVVGTVAGNLIVENVLEPTMTGRALDLSPTVVFVSFFVWTWLLGPAGMLMSMPITVMLMLALDADERTRWASRLIGWRPGARGGVVAPSVPSVAEPSPAELAADGAATVERAGDGP